MDVPKASGVTLHTYLVLHEDSGQVSGTVSPNGSGEIRIREVRREGGDVAFKIDWGWNFRVRPEGPNLHVVISYDGGGRDEAVAVPVSAESMRAPKALPIPPACATCRTTGSRGRRPWAGTAGTTSPRPSTTGSCARRPTPW